MVSDRALMDSRSLTPVSRTFGLDRGTPIDRYYIERFLQENSGHVRGRVLESGDAAYTRRFGGNRVTASDVLHAVAGNRHATIVGDLESGEAIPTAAFDCIILTQVLPFVFDVRGAISTVHRALKPGGVVLATVPGISQISRYDMDRWGDFWRFTSLSARRLFEQAFAHKREGEAPAEPHLKGLSPRLGGSLALPTPARQTSVSPVEPEPRPPKLDSLLGEVEVRSFGNVLVASSFLNGLALEELRPEELDPIDRDYQVIITIKATRGLDS